MGSARTAAAPATPYHRPAQQGPPPSPGSDRVAAAHRRAVAGPARLLRSVAHGRQPLLPLASPGCVRPAAGRDHPPRRRPRRAGLVGALRGRQRGPRPPARRRRTAPAERGGPQGGSAPPLDEALGRSRGGLSSKLHLRVEGGGRPLSILVTAGQRHEAPLLPALLDAGAVRRSGPAGRPGRARPRKRPERLVADKGYSYPSVRAELRRRGIGAVIPTRSNQRRRPGFDRAVYADRNRVEIVCTQVTKPRLG